MLEILRVRSVGVQLLLTTGSSSICTYEAESLRGAQVSFHWNRAIKIAVSLRYTLPKYLSDECISHFLSYFLFRISKSNLFRRHESNYIYIEYKERKRRMRDGEKNQKRKMLLSTESMLQKSISVLCDIQDV